MIISSLIVLFIIKVSKKAIFTTPYRNAVMGRIFYLLYAVEEEMLLLIFSMRSLHKKVPHPGFEGRWDLAPLVEVVVEVEVEALGEAKLLFMLMLFTNANNG